MKDHSNQANLAKISELEKAKRSLLSDISNWESRYEQL